jgi:hypothetical protein
MTDSLANQLTQKIREVVLGLEEAGCDIIQPNWVANTVFNSIDPEKDAPEIVAYSSLQHIAQMTRKVLAHRHDPITKAKSYAAGISDDLFGNILQDYYPARRDENNDPVYVRRDQMTKIECRRVSCRMRKAGTTLVEHADALDAFSAQVG